MRALDSCAIRSAGADDVDCVVRLEEACFADPWLERSIVAGLSDGNWVFLVAESAGEVVGYGIAWVVVGEGEIARVGVRPDLRGRGLGLQLTWSLVRDCAARGASDLFLEVRDGNLAARKIYERAGFTVAGRRKRYYADGEDAIVMHLKITKC